MDLQTRNSVPAAIQPDPVTGRGETEHCRNCEAPVAGKFCARCGQQVTHGSDYSIRHFVEHALHEVTHFDNKLFRTIKPLLLKPGYLTAVYFAGRQQRYMKPLALFVFVNFLFFLFKQQGLLQYHLDSFRSGIFGDYLAQKMAASGLSQELYTAKFNMSMKYQQKSYLIFLVPLLALGLQLLYWRRKRYYVEHLVFSLHFFSFFPIYLTVLPYALAALFFIFTPLHLGMRDSEEMLLLVTAPPCVLWLFLAVKRFYQEHWATSLLKALLLTLLVFWLIGFVYRLGLFLLVVHSVH